MDTMEFQKTTNPLSIEMTFLDFFLVTKKDFNFGEEKKKKEREEFDEYIKTRTFSFEIKQCWGCWMKHIESINQAGIMKFPSTHVFVNRANKRKREKRRNDRQDATCFLKILSDSSIHCWISLYALLKQVS